ncbi:MAG: hypothetical protein MJ053_06815, partial [Elusimicrobiaceae bacterium]|nr:hypothetical protein [Elusimicrobiaceae bacterium]
IIVFFFDVSSKICQPVGNKPLFNEPKMLLGMFYEVAGSLKKSKKGPNFAWALIRPKPHQRTHVSIGCNYYNIGIYAAKDDNAVYMLHGAGRNNIRSSTDEYAGKGGRRFSVAGPASR